MKDLPNQGLTQPTQPKFITLRFKAVEGKCLLKFDIKSMHEDECRFQTELKIQSADIFLPEQFAHLIKAIIPSDNVVEIMVLGDDTPLAKFVWMDLKITQPPTPDNFFVGWHSITFMLADTILDLWEQHGSPMQWKITAQEVEEFIEAQRQAKLKQLQEVAKQRGLKL